MDALDWRQTTEDRHTTQRAFDKTPLIDLTQRSFQFRRAGQYRPHFSKRYLHQVTDRFGTHRRSAKPVAKQRDHAKAIAAFKYANQHLLSGAVMEGQTDRSLQDEHKKRQGMLFICDD